MIKHLIIGVLLLAFFSTPFATAAEDPDELYRKGRFSEAEKAYARSDMDQPRTYAFVTIGDVQLTRTPIFRGPRPLSPVC